eukprot:6197508-Pleurochrysis_carterae.AAC.1
MTEKVAEERFLLGSKTTGCSFSLAGNGGKINLRVIGKHAQVRNVRVVGLPGSVRVEVKAILTTPASQRASKFGQRWSCRRAQASCFSWSKGLEELFSAGVIVIRRVMHEEAKHERVVGDVWPSHCRGVERERACVRIAHDLEADKLVDTSRYFAPEAFAVTYIVGRRKLVEENFVLAGVGDGAVVNPNNDEEKRAVGLEGQDARFAPQLRKAMTLEEIPIHYSALTCLQQQKLK